MRAYKYRCLSICILVASYSSSSSYHPGRPGLRQGVNGCRIGGDHVSRCSAVLHMAQPNILRLPSRQIRLLHHSKGNKVTLFPLPVWLPIEAARAPAVVKQHASKVDVPVCACNECC